MEEPKTLGKTNASAILLALSSPLKKLAKYLNKKGLTL